jgi:hypothetical protein
MVSPMQPCDLRAFIDSAIATGGSLVAIHEQFRLDWTTRVGRPTLQQARQLIYVISQN